MFDEAHYSFAQILHMITNDRHKSNIWYNHKTNECLMWCAGNLGVGDLIIMLQAMETKHGEDKQGVEDRHKDGDGAHEVEEGSKEDSGDASQGDSIVL
jgi:heterodisulfide reductase subunit C